MPAESLTPHPHPRPRFDSPEDAETVETMARTLEATGNYKILRRLVPRPAEHQTVGDRVGLIIDLETTGLDTSRNEVLEIAAIKFG